MGVFVKTADFERRRVQAIRMASNRPGYSSWSTGPRTSRGALKMAANATRHGGDSQVVKLAMQYADSVLLALEPKS